jgi:small redox-active disulfide protein 2
MKPQTLLAILAHPDDESNAAGGTLARYAREGKRVVIVSATRGERGIPGLGLEETARVRERELCAAGAALGAEVRFLDYLDGELDNANQTEAVAKITALLAELSPDIVLTFGPDGISGHPDHVAVSQWVTRAFDATPTVRKLYYIAPSAATQQACGVPPPRDVMGGPAASIDVGQYRDAKARAMQCHTSQMSAQIDASALECHEYFRLARSRVSEIQDETGLFAGISTPVPRVIKILGAGCARCSALENEIQRTIGELGISVRVERVENVDAMKRYGLLSLPGLVIDGRLVCAGRVPARGEITAILHAQRSVPDVEMELL